jgi:hypothetical protein
LLPALFALLLICRILAKVRSTENTARTARFNNKHLYTFGAKVADTSAAAAVEEDAARKLGHQASERDAYSIRGLTVRHRFTDPMAVDATISPGWMGSHRCVA